MSRVSEVDDFRGKIRALWKRPGRDDEKEAMLVEFNRARLADGLREVTHSDLNSMTGEVSVWP